MHRLGCAMQIAMLAERPEQGEMFKSQAAEQVRKGGHRGSWPTDSNS
jgi:hypothetical protein